MYVAHHHSTIAVLIGMCVYPDYLSVVLHKVCKQRKEIVTGHCKQKIRVLIVSVGRDSSVGIATRYGLDCPGIESQWGRDFPHPSRPALGPTHPMGTGSFLGVKRPGRGLDHPPPSSAEVKERVELYL